MSNTLNTARRHFLRAGAGLAAAAGIPSGHGLGTPLALSLAGLGAAAAQGSAAATLDAPYRALVCLFMNGGNDSHNWVVPVDATGFADYQAARRELAWSAAGLQPITSTRQASGRRFAMPQELQPLRTLYDAGRCAVVANVGTLDRPVTRADFDAGVNLPSKLFSHNDQQSIWQSLSPEGARSGWGGRLGDLLMSANQYPVFTALSATGNAVFLTGSNVTQYQVGADGPVTVDALSQPWLHGSGTAAAALGRVVQMGGNNPWQAEYAKVMQRSTSAGSVLRAALARTSVAALPTAPVVLPGGAQFVPANDGLARQLRMVAQLIAAAPGLGMRRQVFMVSMGGFDTHTGQMRDQPLLMAKVANAVAGFMAALDAAGQAGNVTLFTASDFGRTLSCNGDGSDHGWGSHHLVVGGAVKGRDIYGRFPTTALGTADDIGSGRLLPSTSVTEYAATLGRWLGASATDLASVLPNLGRFSSSDLGFL
jgi:uncharacterized protein (DUF1501 family)